MRRAISRIAKRCAFNSASSSRSPKDKNRPESATILIGAIPPANLLRKWVVLQTGRPRSAMRPAKLLAVTALPSPAPDALRSPVPAASPGQWQLELVVPGGTIRIRGRIDAESLRTVLDCLASRA